MGYVEWNPSPEELAFFKKNVASMSTSLTADLALNPKFIGNYLGVQDYSSKQRDPPKEIDVFPIVRAFETQPDGWWYNVGKFKPEAVPQIREILRNAGYENMDRINIRM
jgi:hypothetical protein